MLRVFFTETKRTEILKAAPNTVPHPLEFNYLEPIYPLLSWKGQKILQNVSLDFLKFCLSAFVNFFSAQCRNV